MWACARAASASRERGTPIGDGNPLLKDVKLRQALQWAVDRQALVDKVLGGGGTQLRFRALHRTAISASCAMHGQRLPDARHHHLRGPKRWITNAGVSTYYTVMAAHSSAK